MNKPWHVIERYEDSAVIVGIEYQPWVGDGTTYVLYVVDKIQGYTTPFIRRNTDAQALMDEYERFVVLALLYQDHLKGKSTC